MMGLEIYLEYVSPTFGATKLISAYRKLKSFVYDAPLIRQSMILDGSIFLVS